MAVIRTETDNYDVVAHDTVMTFPGESLHITFDHDHNYIRTGMVPELRELTLEINFKEDNGEGKISTRAEDGKKLIIDVFNSKTAQSLIGGATEVIKIGNLGTRELYLNFAFTTVNKSVWLTYVIYRSKK